MLSEIRKKVNQTDHDIPEKLLHEDFFRNAAEDPVRIAVAQRDGNGEYEYFTYGMIADKALRYSSQLKKKGFKPGDIVAVVIEKSAEYISAIMGILAAGCTYLPMSSSVPDERRKFICEKANISGAVTSEENKVFFEKLNIKTITPSEAETSEAEESYTEIPVASSAYIIFTSGTTGTPKGVEIQHYAAHNTIADINERFGVSRNDAVFAVSEIDFDLSVYDVFGLLSVGGKVVISDRGMKKEAGLWKTFMAHENVTVWNSVPMLFEMLICADTENEAAGKLKLAMVSGDWVYPSLVNKFREKNSSARMIALGGATEASIWSNYFDAGNNTDPDWKSVPYGVPLYNQKYRIVKEDLTDCEDNEPGEILIGGKGLAKGYINSPDLTSERFITDSGERWYRTGDKGMYWPDGNIEFLGRLDDQVKFGGFRVELGEITGKLLAHESVKNAHSVMVQNSTRQYLASVVVEANDGSKCVPEILSTESDNTDILAAQKQVNGFVIKKILGIEDCSIRVNIDDHFTSLGFVPEHRNLYDYWIESLKNDGIIKLEDGIITAGDRFDITPDKEVYEAFKEIIEKADFIADILKGTRDKADMLKDEVLSPEKLSAQEPGILKSIDIIADRINDKYDDDGMNMNIAFTGARTGLLAKYLLEKVSDADVSLTLIDSSEFFIAQAKQNLADEDCSFEIIKEYVPEELRNSFDMVISVNDFHTKEDIPHAVFIIKDMLKKNGTAFVTDLKEMPPVSGITAAVIENGFERFTEENRPVSKNPIVPPEKMCEYFADAGFRKVTCRTIEKSVFMFIEASEKNINEALSVNALKYYLSGQLPEYMVPEKIIFLDKIPLNKNGKADKDKITELVSEENNIELVPPKTETEKKIAELWKEILCVKEVGINQSFFQAGGDSLLATHLLTVVKKQYDIELSLKEMYNDPTLEAIAASIDEKLAENNDDDTEFGEI
ncbi:amino acid adenylation domain-containing protein [Ruminococcus sp. HUN007]|uniref:amino acid adenylation domain-containing protein n=1 Tax=Ruminococcus sp. HUN007 TaxID=1514668 RepID=UPI0005D2ADBD|nr:amino acid adenylation domain-containing protein [Ruminococcus sp. HUN007]